MSDAPSQPSTIDTFEDEDVLADDYPVYGNFIYVADGRVYMSDWHGITVRQLKSKEGFKEVRRCNIAARRAAPRLHAFKPKDGGK
jgi:hypothetical protein